MAASFPTTSPIYSTRLAPAVAGVRFPAAIASQAGFQPKGSVAATAVAATAAAAADTAPPASFVEARAGATASTATAASTAVAVDEAVGTTAAAAGRVIDSASSGSRSSKRNWSFVVASALSVAAGKAAQAALARLRLLRNNPAAPAAVALPPSSCAAVEPLAPPPFLAAAAGAIAALSPSRRSSADAFAGVLPAGVVCFALAENLMDVDRCTAGDGSEESRSSSGYLSLLDSRHNNSCSSSASEDGAGSSSEASSVAGTTTAAATSSSSRATAAATTAAAAAAGRSAEACAPTAAEDLEIGELGDHTDLDEGQPGVLRVPAAPADRGSPVEFSRSSDDWELRVEVPAVHLVRSSNGINGTASSSSSGSSTDSNNHNSRERRENGAVSVGSPSEVQEISAAAAQGEDTAAAPGVQTLEADVWRDAHEEEVDSEVSATAVRPARQQQEQQEQPLQCRELRRVAAAAAAAALGSATHAAAATAAESARVAASRAGEDVHAVGGGEGAEREGGEAETTATATVEAAGAALLRNHTGEIGAAQHTEEVSFSLGCLHYRRKCKVVAPCCGEIFWCRHCHNEVKSDQEKDYKKAHEIDRTAVKEIICAVCEKRQEVSNACTFCGTQFGLYFCPKCKFWDDQGLMKKVYHCDMCGLCRTGGSKNFFHCNTCGSCYSKEIENSHKCIEKAMHQPCPICCEHMFTSVRQVHVLKCGHTFHGDCLEQLKSECSGMQRLRCPLCCKSLGEYSQFWKRLDEEVARTPLPDELKRKAICKCNDCDARSEVDYHVVGLKCGACGGYNTHEVAP